MSLVLAWALLAASSVDFVESRFEIDGDLLSYETPDVDQDDRGDVLLVTREGTDRILRLHLQTADGGFPAAPTFRLALPRDVVGYGLFDLRDEPGREIVLFTRKGVFSVSPTLRGLRGNLRRELELPLFPDLAAADDVLRWDWMRDIDGDGAAELIVPTDGALLALTVDRAADGRSTLRPIATLPCPTEAETASPGVDIRIGRSQVNVRRDLPVMFPGRPGRPPSLGERHLLRRSETWSLPRLVDWDGDGRLDAAWQDGGGVLLRRQDGGARFAKAERLNLPESEDEDVSLRLIDVDGDGQLEAVRVSGDRDGLTRDYGVTIYRRDGAGLDPTPRARIKMNAGNARFSFHDVDSDGRLDLVVRAVDIPTGLDQLTSIRIDTKVLVFRGTDGAGLSPRPDARWERSLKPDDLTRIRESFVAELEGDLDGDGLSDLLVLRPDGLLQVLPLVRDGAGLRFSEAPLSSYLPKRPVRAARPAYLSHDGVWDLVLTHDNGLTVFVSRAEAGK